MMCVITKDARGQLPQRQINRPCFAADNAPTNLRDWYQLGFQMALPIIKQGLEMNTTINQNESHVLHVENKSIQVETAGENIAMKRADSQPIGNGENKPRYGDKVTQHVPGNSRFYLPNGYTRKCDHCGQDYIAKRDTSRFCGRRCRVAAHRARGNK